MTTIGKGLGVPGRDEFEGWIEAVVEEMTKFFVMEFMHEHLELQEFESEYNQRCLDMHSMELEAAVKAAVVRFFRQAYRDSFGELLLPRPVE